MIMARTRVAFAALAALGLSASAASSAELLGCQNVGFLKDRDTIKVGKSEGRFKAIKLEVKKAPIELIDLKVIYGNGQADDLPVRSNIPAGGATRWIDLKGDKRFIKEIDLIYRSKPTFQGLATVCAYGR